ncbi:MAG: DUF1615 domain-containing protein [Rhizobacter sp.]
MALSIRRAALLPMLVCAWLAGCASRNPSSEGPSLRPEEARALIAQLLPAQTGDRAGWATDIHAAFTTLRIAPTPGNICSVVAITEQESGFRADPEVPRLAAIAWQQIEQRAQRAGVPMPLVRLALQVPSPTGKSYSERIDAARTERELSEVFDDFIGMVPMGRRLFASWNPVRTGGPMQVSVEFAQVHAQEKPYPYPVDGTIRHEVFTRRGGMYFGIAHLLDYPAGYDSPLYRFADFNAGRYASRNAALQNAISVASGIPLVPDGDLIRHDGADKAGNTEAAARALASRLGMSESAIRADLEQGASDALERTALYRRVFELADTVEGRPLPRAVLPQIELHSPKITRKLTTAWFANRVDERYRRCLARAPRQD